MTTEQAETQTTTEEVTATSQPEVAATPEVSTGAGEGVEGSAPAETREGTAETEGDAEIDIGSLMATELAAQTGVDLPDTPETAAKPAGIAVEEWERNERASLSSLNGTIRRDAEAFLKGVLREAGLSDAQISTAWESKGRHIWNDFVRSNDAFWETLLDDQLLQGLTPEQKEIWGKTKHRNREEYRDKLIDLGRHEVTAAQQADIKAGKLVSKTVAEKAGIETAKKAIAARDKQYEAQGMFLAKSGGTVDTSVAGGRKSFRSIREAEAAHVKGEITSAEMRRLRDTELPY